MKELKTHEKKNNKKPMKIILTVLLLLLIVAGYVFSSEFRLNNIEIKGNVHYTKKEIDKVLSDKWYMGNTLLCILQNKVYPIEDMPFIDYVDIELTSNHTITVTVYEKAMAGCVKQLGQYLYFDKDGVVLESSSTRLADIPCVEGLQFDSFKLHEKLPIEDEDKFALILKVTQLLKEYELEIDQVRFSLNDNLILYKDSLIIQLGKGDNLEEKIANLPNILEKAKGMSGTLYMEDYTSQSQIIIFK